MKVTEEEIQQLRKADGKTQKAIFLRSYPKLLGVCKMYTTDTMLAEDSVTTAFIQAYKSVSAFRYQTEFSFYNWIKVIAIREVLYEVRKNRNFLSLDVHEATAIAIDPDALATLENADVLRMVNSLPESQRVVFILYLVEGFQHTEISDLLGISESNSKVLLHRAKLSLKEILFRENKNLKANGKVGS